MKDRIKKIRKELDLTQQEFASKIGTSQNVLANYEIGRRNPSSSVINNICKTFNVNEEWLRNGVGDMYLPVNREDEIAKAIKNLLDGESDSFKNRLITVLAGLSTSDWERLETEAKKLLTTKEKSRAVHSESTKQTNTTPKVLHSTPSSAADEDDEIERQVAEYRQYLEIERKVAEKSSVSRKNA